MSTRSRIGIIRTKDASGEPSSVESIYCHWDGYPEGVGATLLDYWTDTASVNELLALGDLSVLGAILGEKHAFEQRHEDTPSYEMPCCAYGRDRGESGTASETHPYGDWPDSGQEYEYLLTATGWVYRASAYGKPSGDPWHILEREKVAS